MSYKEPLKKKDKYKWLFDYTTNQKPRLGFSRLSHEIFMLGKKMKNIICEYCNKIFTTRNRNYTQKFCSHECHNNEIKLKAKTDIEEYNNNPNNCQNPKCNKPILHTKNIKLKNTKIKKYCCSSCAAKVTNLIPNFNRKRGPKPLEKIIKTKAKKEKLVFPFCKISFKICPHTKKLYLSRNSDGSVRYKSPFLNKNEKQKYYENCKFKFNVYEYPNKFDLNLLNFYGWYSTPGSNKKGIKNINGISRDHMFSISEGYKLGIHPKIISHPANCCLLKHTQNQNKKHKCSITYEELLKRIEKWDGTPAQKLH